MATTRKKTKDTTSAAVVWFFKSRKQCFGLHVDDEACWLGDEAGNVYALDHSAKLKRQLKLPSSVKALVGDGQWLYAAADKQVYDLSGKTPRLAYSLETAEVLWMDISFGSLFTSDSSGNIAAFDHEGEELWRKKSKGDTAWMVRVDERAAFHGYDRGVTAYARDGGKKLWSAKVKGCTWFGAQNEVTAYACTDEDLIYAFDKEDGKQRALMECDDSVNACAATADGRRVYAADSDKGLYAFDKKGKRLWKLELPDSALSVQLRGDRLYGSAQNGGLICVDISDEAVEKAQAGTRPKVKASSAPADVKTTRTDALERASAKDVAGGVKLVCVKVGGKLRIKVESPGFKKDWHVQFPRNLRVAGARFVVEKVVEAGGRGNFYRTVGEIRRVE